MDITKSGALKNTQQNITKRKVEINPNNSLNEGKIEFCAIESVVFCLLLFKSKRGKNPQA
jgi:hypothetical protein